eukprot:10143381-Alexandrium_andersonii.AAC.1
MRIPIALCAQEVTTRRLHGEAWQGPQRDACQRGGRLVASGLALVRVNVGGVVRAQLRCKGDR